MKMPKMIFFRANEDGIEDESKEIYFDKIDILDTKVFIPSGNDYCKNQLYSFLKSIQENGYTEKREAICLDPDFKIYFILYYKVGARKTKLEIGVVQKSDHSVNKIQSIKFKSEEAQEKIEECFMYCIKQKK
jgi:hypothetical protein